MYTRIIIIKKMTLGCMRVVLCCVLRDHKNVSMPIKFVAGSLYLTAVAQLNILKTFQHISHLR